MLDALKYDVVKLILSVEIQTEEDARAVEEQRRAEQIRTMSLNHEEGNESPTNKDNVAPFKRPEKKIGRNDACPCGSGKNTSPAMAASHESSCCYYS